MTLHEFEATLQGLLAGEETHVPYDLFGELFPPGEPDDEARGRALQLAIANDCYVENRPRCQELIFVKVAWRAVYP